MAATPLRPPTPKSWADSAVARVVNPGAKYETPMWDHLLMADTKLTGSAGEHWVCSVLAARGWTVALTRDGIAHTDILAVHPGPPRIPIEVQVKTASYGTGNWRVNRKAQEPSVPQVNEWFVFVQLAEPSWASPTAYVVPRNHVRAMAHIAWLKYRTDPSLPTATLAKRNADLNDTRLHADPELHGYKNRWDLLSRPTNEAPWPSLLPLEFQEFIADFGLDWIDTLQ